MKAYITQQVMTSAGGLVPRRPLKTDPIYDQCYVDFILTIEIGGARYKGSHHVSLCELEAYGPRFEEHIRRGLVRRTIQIVEDQVLEFL